jgi:hypothetical protein
MDIVILTRDRDEDERLVHTGVGVLGGFCCEVEPCGE